MMAAREPHVYRRAVGMNPLPADPPVGAVDSALVALIYKPLGLILGILAGLVGRRVFDKAWEKIDDEDPPKGTTEQASWGKVLSAAALQGVIFKVVRVVVDRYGAIGWHYLTGTWPGEKRPDRQD